MPDSTSGFFKHSAAYKHLENILSSQIKALVPEDCFRVWVVGCATGEEVYSLAMLLQDYLERFFEQPPTLRIFATDTNLTALQIARKGLYSEQQISTIPQHLREKYLIKTDKGFEISKKLRASILFSYHDLTADPPFLKINLLSCHNVWNKLKKSAQKSLVVSLLRALQDNGILFLDESDKNKNLENIFDPIEPYTNIFRKRKNVLVQPIYRYKPAGVAPRSSKKAAELEAPYRDCLLDVFGTLTNHAVLVVNQWQQIIETRGNIKELLQIPDGVLKLDINTLVCDNLRTEVKRLLLQLTRAQHPIKFPMQKIMLNGQMYYVRLQGSPLPDSQSGLYMLVIEKFSYEELLQLDVPVAADASAEQNERIKELEKSINTYKQNLAAYIEDLETANEELQAANEELQTANEELQSTNEELKTAYAEIKKVNQELIAKEQSESRTSQIFSCLFNNTQQGNILLDSSWNIVLINPRAKELLLSVGIAITKQPANLADLDMQNQIVPLLQKAQQLKKITAEVLTLPSPTAQLYYEFFVNPIPTAAHNAEEELIAVSIIDRTEEKRRERELFKHHAWMNALVESVNTFVMRIDLQGRYTYVNRALCEKLGYSPQEFIGRHYCFAVYANDYELCKQQMARLLTLPAGSVVSVELRQLTQSGTLLFTEWEFVLIKTSDNQPAEIQGIGRDITHQKHTQIALQEERNHLELIIWSGRLGTWDWNLQTGQIRFNERWAEMLGYQIEELNFSFEQWQQLIHPEDRARVLKAIEDCLKGNTASYEVEHREKTKSGEWKWLVAIGKVVERDSKGKPLRVLGIHQDITDKKRSEEAARLSEERNKAVLHTMQDGIVVQDMTGAIISCNHSAEKILGLTYEQMIGRTSVDPRWRATREDGSPFPGEEHPAMVTIRTGQPQSNVLMGVHKPSGEVSWISVNTQLLCHPDTQTPYAVFAIFHDITQRRKVELALEAAHKRFESIVDSTDGIVWELDYQTFCFTYVSRKAERLLGYPLDEWYQPDFWKNHLHPQDRERAIAYCIACSERLEPHEFEYHFIARDGRVVWLRDIVTVVAADNKPTLLRGIMIDITKHKEMEQMLERLSLVAKRTSNAVVITDKKRRIVWVNEAFTKITGYSFKEVIGRTPKMFQFEGTDPATIAYLRERLNQEQPAYCEILNRGKHGNQYWLEIEIQPLFDNNRELTGFMAIQTDITERKKTEEHIRKQNEILKDIAFIQSHVLRRPIANILSLLHLIEIEKGHNKIDTLYEYLDYLLQSARDADNMIHQIAKKTNEIEHMLKNASAVNNNSQSAH
ncbi:MAG: PAS domain S-box protein [Cytophagales bacterium]|nr:PAS domain S-box protein [Cytophagales bacterium]